MARLPYLTAFALMISLIIGYFLDGYSENYNRSIVRITAKLSFIFFIVAFNASSIHRIFRSTWSSVLLKNRKYLGLSFAVSHTFHLFCILLLQCHFQLHNFEERGVFTVFGGAIAYVFLYLMSFTSNEKIKSKLGAKKWNILHIVGSYYILIVFAVSYIPRALNSNVYIPFATLIVMTLIGKFFFLISRRG